MNILSIQSEVVYGHVGNAVARFVLQRLGHAAWCVPTVLLSSHAGHAGFTGEPLPAEFITTLIDGLAAQNRLAVCDGVLSGYLGSADQAARVADAVLATRAANPAARYCFDPAFGDDGRIYARPGVAEAMARELLPLADIVTPNAFELSQLAGMPVTDAATAREAAESLERPIVVCTSVPHGAHLGTLMVVGGEAWLAETPRLGSAPRGAGDLFSALLFARLLEGLAPVVALELAVRATYHVLRRSGGHDEMQLIVEQQRLAAPPLPAGFGLTQLHSGRRALG